ncbi:MAG: translocation/assembly module TamB domain-containing protein [Candidatus Lustribacter sp.]
MLIAGTALLALVVVAAAALVFHDALAGAIIRAVAGGMGYDVRFGRLQVGFTSATAMDTSVTGRTGEPVFAAGRIDVQYALRYVLPGSGRRRFGISALDIQRPTLTLIHHADGTYNVTLPPNAAAAKPDTTPIDLRVRVREGSVVLLDRFVVPGQERRQRIVGLAADAALVPHAHSFYNVRFDLDDGRALHPVYGKATFAADRGYEAQRWTARDIPVGPLLDFALSTHAANVVDGDARNVDARIYAFVDPGGATHTHTSLRTDLVNGKIYVAGIDKPLRDAHGTILAYDDGLTTNGLDGTLAGVPLHVAGGVYDFAAPHLRFALTGHGQIAQLQQAVAASQRQPVTGDLSFALLASGSLSAPVVNGDFSSPQLVYRTFPLEHPNGTFSLHGRDLELLEARFAYGPVNVEAHGNLALETNVRTNLVVGLHADGDRLPYLPQLMRGLDLNAVVHVAGTGTRLASTGIVYGNGSNGALDAIFDVDGNGDGVIGPLSIARTDGASLYARVALDRTHGSVLAIAGVQRFSLLPARAFPALPGLPGGTLRPLAGRLDAQLVGAVDGSRLDGLRGHVRLTGFRYGALTANAAADLGTAADGTQRGSVHVASSLGTLDGNAAYAGGLVGFDGRLRSSFAQLQTLTGKLDARGTIDGPLLALSNGASSAVETPGLQLHDAAVAGVPLRDLSASATLNGQRLDVRALQLGVAGGTVIAQGALGDGGELTATTSALELPQTGGVLRVVAHVRGTLAAPRADVALLVTGARVHGVDLSANAFAHYEGGTLHVNDATALAADSYATASGEVRNLTAGSPDVDVRANLHGAQIGPLARALRLPLRYPDGELDADLHAVGPASAPQLTAAVRIPNGSLNGLNYRDASVALAGRPGNLAARNGTVTVGTTNIAFSGELAAGAESFAVRAPRVELADFDDYFDSADTLGGHGHVNANAALSHSGVSATGDLRIDDARYRDYNVGTVSASWNTSGRTVHATGGAQTDHGTIALTGAVTFAADDPLRDARQRTTIAADGTLAGLDLAQWLPTAGLRLPILGVASGSLHVTGTPAAPAFAATAAVNDALVLGYPLSTLTLTASGDTHGARIGALRIAGPGLTADAAGSFGYGAHDPIAIALHAQSDDAGVLAKSLGAKLDVAGAVTTTVNLSGSRSAPRVTQTLDASNLRSHDYTLPHAHVQLAADPDTVNLQTFEADFVRGRLVAGATLPIQLAPPGIRNAPLTASLRAEGIDLAQFDTLLPASSKLGGTIDGSLALSGTESNPALDGTLTLAGGSFASNLVRSAFTNARAQLALSRTQAQLTGVHADIGGGAIDGSATATFGDLRDSRRTLALTSAFTIQHAALNVANLFRGQIDGMLDVTKPQGDIPTVGGTLVLSKTRLPLAALIPHTPANPNAHAPPTVAFALNVQIGNDFRVQGPGIDIGAQGAVTVGGNLAHPELDGRVSSTSGTLSFYRTFVLHAGTVVFAPSDGLIPDVDATATTHVTNPDTDILLHVTGPATSLNLDLSSNPSYDKEQILGLLVNAQALGAVPGVETASGGGGIDAGSIAGGFLGQELTQSLLEPIGSSLGQSLGFEDLALGYDFGSGLSAGARKQLGKNLYATFNQSFGGDERQSIALNYTLPRNTAIALTAFNAGNEGPSLLHTQQLFAPVGPTDYTLQALAPPPGIAGVVLTYQRKFR